ncbi:MAG: hypothetical protein WC149_02055 [Arcobacteraceae bacterium]
MKKAVNLRLDENVLITLEQLSQEFHTTKTDIIEKSIQFFSKQKRQNDNHLLQFAGTLKSKEADEILNIIQNDKNSKDFSLDLE